MAHRHATLSLLLCGLLSGCATNGLIILDRAMVYNATGQIISDVKVRHEPTKRIGAISEILPGKAFDLGFSQQPMLADHGIVSWTERGGRRQHAKVNLPNDPEAAKRGDAMTLIYTIQPSGAIIAELRPSGATGRQHL